MIYELAHFIKDKCSFLWDAVEWGNASLFALQYRAKLKGIPRILEDVSNDTFTISEIGDCACRLQNEVRREFYR